jgi:hypothetical protein
MKPSPAPLAVGLLAALTLAFFLFRPSPAPSPSISPDSHPTPLTASPTTPTLASSERRGTNNDLASWLTQIASTPVSDFRKLMEDALALPDASLRAAVVRALVEAWIGADIRDFNQYFASLEVLGNEAHLGQLVAALQSVLPTLDPAMANSDAVRALVQRLITHLVKEDPDQAWNWANTWLPEHSREAALVPIAREFARRSPTAGLGVVERMVSPLRRMQAMAAVGNVWAKSNPQAALDWARALPLATERAMTLNAVLLAVAQDNPQLAAINLRESEQTMNDQYRRQREADLAALGLTQIDLVNDPASYEELVASGGISPPESPDVELMADAARVIAEKLAATDPASATALAEAVENPFLNRKTQAGAIAGWAATDPDAALAHLNLEHPGNTELVAALFEVWGETDPTSALASAAQLGTAQERTVARDTAFATWAAEDPQAAGRYLEALPATERSDAAITAVVQALSPLAPQDAWNQAQTINDPNQRYRALRTAFAVLATDQPEVAQSLLASASLDRQHAERLEEMLRAVSLTP